MVVKVNFFEQFSESLQLVSMHCKSNIFI